MAVRISYNHHYKNQYVACSIFLKYTKYILLYHDAMPLFAVVYIDNIVLYMYTSPYSPFLHNEEVIPTDVSSPIRVVDLNDAIATAAFTILTSPSPSVWIT